MPKFAKIDEKMVNNFYGIDNAGKLKLAGNELLIVRLLRLVSFNFACSNLLHIFFETLKNPIFFYHCRTIFEV